MQTVVFAYHNMGLAGVEALLRNDYDIKAIFTHKDDPHEYCWFGSVKDWAKTHKIPVYEPDEINTQHWIKKIARMQPDIIFAFYYRKMICREIIELPPQGAFNLHGSLLPRYRGRCPVNWVLIHGEKKTGVTLHYMTFKPDAGDIVGQKAVVIDFADTAKTLYDKMCHASNILLNELLPLMKKGAIPRRKQNLEAGSYFGGRKPEDGRIDWTKSALDIYNLIRAVTEPYPGAFGLLDNNDKFIIWWAQPLKCSNGKSPGSIVMNGKDVLVQTGKGALKLEKIEVSAKLFIGKQIFNYLRKKRVKKLK